MADAQDAFQRMDKNANGAVTQPEMQSTGVLMPASLTDGSLHAMLDYLKQQTSEQAQAAAKIRAEGGPSPRRRPDAARAGPVDWEHHPFYRGLT